MKISTLILAIWLAASAWAQAPPPQQQPGSPAAATPQKAKEKPSASPAKAPAQSSATRHGRSQHAAELPADGKSTANGKPAVKGRRDPFVSPIVERQRAGANCTGSGRQCLLVGDIVLQGVVRYTGGFIAVVTSSEHTYFLHDNDPLADGDVERINKDSITLRQRSTDILGRSVVHEITKKLGVPAV
jgi:hypothetical protein